MNKKGLIFSAVMYIPKLIFLGIVVIILITLISLFVQTDIDYFPLEAQVYSRMIVYPEDSLAYHNPYSNRVYPGILGEKPEEPLPLFYFGEDTTYMTFKTKDYEYVHDKDIMGNLVLYRVGGTANLFPPLWTTKGESSRLRVDIMRIKQQK